MYNKHPYGNKRWQRERLPWFIVNWGIAKKGEDCEKVNAKHQWYNIDNLNSGCYFSKLTKFGKLLKK